MIGDTTENYVNGGIFYLFKNLLFYFLEWTWWIFWTSITLQESKESVRESCKSFSSNPTFHWFESQNAVYFVLLYFAINSDFRFIKILTFGRVWSNNHIRCFLLLCQVLSFFVVLWSQTKNWNKAFYFQRINEHFQWM